MLINFKDTIDVAYSMYTYNAEFLLRSTMKTTSDKKQKTGLFRLINPLVEDVHMKKLVDRGRFSRMTDLEDLAQNWLITKALTNFVQDGTIPKVTFIEENITNTDHLHIP